MEVRLASLLQGAQDAEGTVVIIDVYRAFTTAAVAFLKGAEKIILVAEVEEAIALREAGDGDICVGEVEGMRPGGFDFNNSPFEMCRADLTGKTIIQSTRAGTVGVCAATKADRIYGGSLVVSQATAETILKDDPEVVTLVAMGWAGAVRTDEDEQCALYLRNLIQGREANPDHVRGMVMAGEESQKFDNPETPHFHPRDRDIALRIDAAPFSIAIAEEDGLLVARAVAQDQPFDPATLCGEI
ncbi:TPA: 2-phosphosulfolactate phosphatase [Candidatus Latescibacteria bacterium]|nr:2-phosphosulfolactate phosphatase [Candidatus Latescibacterota bacterium]